MDHSSNRLPLSFTTAAALAALVTLGTPQTADAGISACGNIDVEAQAECKVEVSGGCLAKCEPVRFEAACAGKLYVDCEGMCEGSAQAECTGECEGECGATCEVDPGEFECQGSCEASCGANCKADCKAHAEGSCEGDGCEAEAEAQCKASCQASCDGECQGSCKGTPPEAECDGKCEASCKGECRAEANFNCQVECQSEFYAECQAELQGGCEVECESPDGALFCDGQYVDHGGKLNECINALKKIVAKVDVSAQGSAAAQCAGGECEAEAEGSVKASCAVLPAQHSNSARGLLGGLFVLVGLAWSARKRRV